jgi:hypothetical protein
MGKHTTAENKLGISKEVQQQQPQNITPYKDNSAPQAPKVGTNAKNQYR